MDLSATFLASWAGPPPADRRGLGALLERCVERGRRAWPGIEVPAARFATHLADRLPATASIDTLESTVFVEESYLACACRAAIPDALRAFEQRFLSQVPRHLARMNLAADVVDEVGQRVREKLFVGSAPKIGDYSGRGPLDGWLRVAALRTALDLIRQQRSDVDVDRGWDAVAAGDPEMDLLIARHRQQLTSALQAAIASVAPADRNLLRLYFAAGRTTAQIGAVLGINQSTVVRRLARLRGDVRNETRRLLRERLQLDSVELESMTRMLHSQIGMSLSLILKSRS